MEKDNYGIIPIDKQYKNLSLCVMEVNPKYPNLDEADILKFMWDKWLGEMEISYHQLILHGSFPKCCGLIKSFIINSADSTKMLSLK